MLTAYVFVGRVNAAAYDLPVSGLSIKQKKKNW